MKTVNSLSGAKNIGKTIARKLNEIGVYTLTDLRKMTSVSAYRQICKRYPNETIPVCYYLYSLQGAILNIDWRNLPENIKQTLKDEII
ncbi:TfoX/Sxy family DNA transformation protein [Olivibacter sp. SDN3]|uniref:TfoX/Sxy family DNA transformation protein n=1 Tax=Olivibacter sp. SDN3 TaxID=2764720 RepID=UPI001650E7A1|nr:TfoX/Sxy family DNA transformation protein [Olivibacter sp. SDN3]QNL48842.1 TfoX/Sxy family DNA transformation protein [Olivibacter sp. SDN3]